MKKIEPNDIISYYLTGKLLKEVAANFNISKSTVYRILCKNNIKTRTISESQRNAKIDHLFFNKYNNVNSYWAGFLAADGCLFRNRSFLISASSKDYEHMFKFANILGANIKYSRQNTAYGKAKIFKVCFASKQIFNDLVSNFNLIPKKSLILKPPIKLNNEEHIRNFIRGYFDGDGHLLGKCFKGIGFSGTEEMLNWIKLIVKKYCIVFNPSVRKDKNIFGLRFCGSKQSSNILKWLYKNSTSNTRLDRKYEIAKNQYYMGVSK